MERDVIPGLDLPEPSFSCPVPPRPDLSPKPRRFTVVARLKPRQVPAEYAAKRAETIACGCGCGATLTRYDQNYRERRFVRGRNAAVAARVRHDARASA